MLKHVNQPLAFVDLETTGATATKDRITEIGIVLVDADGVREWNQLVNPQTRIPLFIEQMTGISNQMVAEMPSFAQVAGEVAELLEGRLFIAHNARFDYGFLKNEFSRVGMTFRPQVLCTVKLSRALYPQFHRHNLDSLIERHGLQAKDRHRALADAQLIHQFWTQACEQFSEAVVDLAAQRLVGRSSLPSNIDPNLIHDLPEAPGVYLFYGENDLPLYIGKSVNIRNRVLAHFGADHKSNKEMSLAQQLRRIDWIETAGELGALLLEARLIKEKSPVHNQRLRRKNALCAWQLQQQGEQLKPVLSWADELDFGAQDNLYGLYHSQRDAQKALRGVAEQHGLCLSVLGLEKTAAGRPCFGYQIKKCRGACVGLEAPLAHAARLLIAMQKLKLAVWPYPGAIGVREGEELHVIDRWCYLGTAKSEAEIEELLRSGRPAFDRDTYMLLSKSLKKAEVVVLPGALEMVGESW
ncbi:3'-5' exonuclease family protein [Methylomonas koyamae]|uniref:DNA-directed DNA polymerase n=1 Tax=Methylomonas koyamae TaxID=702114 RepID=A0A291IGJ7_9GAMM|nr:3'-5' exonuclease family protein [Methylomonas koyamae]ATG89311.1 ethanolamine utilization protein [Methylomonas koyamae]OAI23797.1 ethanolamine utilization protein [Methylomonas koyamae]